MIAIELQFTMPGNLDLGLPGKRCRPGERPTCGDQILVLDDIMKFEVDRLKPFRHESDELAIAIDPVKFGKGIFKINLVGIEFIMLMFRKMAIILLEKL